MKLELIAAAPIREALQKIEELERSRFNEGERQALGTARAELEAALADACNPHFSDGLAPEDAARVLGISADGVRKRIRRGALEAEKRGGRYFVKLGAA